MVLCTSCTNGHRIDAALKRIRLGVGDDRMVLATKEDVEQYSTQERALFSEPLHNMLTRLRLWT